MTAWQVAAWAFAVGLAICVGAALRGGRWDRLIALQLASTLMCSLWICLAVISRQPLFLPLALALAIAASVGTLVFARLLERRR